MFSVCKGLSTYDYIVQQREKEREAEIDDEVASVASSSRKSKRVGVHVIDLIIFSSQGDIIVVKRKCYVCWKPFHGN